MNDTTSVELFVDGMSCGGCVLSVDKALRNVSGVKDVQVDLKSGRAAVKGERLDRAALVRAVSDAGYDVRG
jgi:copper chaperone CopZ